MDQTTIINPAEPRRESWWNSVPRFWPIYISLLVAFSFVVGTYHAFTNVLKDVESIKEEVKNKVDKHDVKDLDDKVNRQWTVQKTGQDKLAEEIEEARDWIEFKKGYEQAIKDLRKK